MLIEQNCSNFRNAHKGAVLNDLISPLVERPSTEDWLLESRTESESLSSESLSGVFDFTADFAAAFAPQKEALSGVEFDSVQLLVRWLLDCSDKAEQHPGVQGHFDDANHPNARHYVLPLPFQLDTHPHPQPHSEQPLNRQVEALLVQSEAHDPTLGQHQQQRSPHPHIVLHRHHPIELHEPKRDQELQEKQTQLRAESRCQHEGQQSHWEHSRHFALCVTQVNVVEEGREGVPVVFACQVVQETLVCVVFTVHRVENSKQPKKYPSCHNAKDNKAPKQTSPILIEAVLVLINEQQRQKQDWVQSHVHPDAINDV